MHSSIGVKGVYRNPCLKPIFTYVSAVSFLSFAKVNLDRKEFNGIRWIFPFNLATLVKENGIDWLLWRVWQCAKNSKCYTIRDCIRARSFDTVLSFLLNLSHLAYNLTCYTVSICLVAGCSVHCLSGKNTLVFLRNCGKQNTLVGLRNCGWIFTQIM